MQPLGWISRKLCWVEKPAPKCCILRDPIYTACWNDKIIGMENRFVFAKDSKGGKGRKEGVPIK